MQDASNPYASFGGQPVAQASADARAEFIKKTYLHLAGAMLAFVVVCWALMQTPWMHQIAAKMGGYMWLGVMVAFMGAGYATDRMAHSAKSVGMQYAGLALSVVIHAIVFMPLLIFASYVADAPGVVTKAAVLTLFMFSGLTLVAFTTKKDFTFMAGFLKVGSLIAMGAIATEVFFVKSAGTPFDFSFFIAAGVVLLASGSILYNTSQIMHHKPLGQHVGAALSLFASIALLFYHILMILLSFSNSD